MKVAVIMCTWQRLDKLKNTIKLLQNQTYSNFDFLIWNNNYDNKDFFKDIVGYTEVYHSVKNIGGIGRFHLAHQNFLKYNYFIFIDDDQLFTKDMVQRFISVADYKSIKSRWAWKFTNNRYDSRHKVNQDNIKVHYLGTGGMIAPSHIFSDKNILNIPEQYSFIEDLWLCYYSKMKLNIELISITDNGFIWQVEDGKDQYLSLISKKNSFLAYLCDLGYINYIQSTL